MSASVDLPSQSSSPSVGKHTPSVILVGNPNVGKSVLFSKLTGKFVIISNYPGTTVEITRGQAKLGDQTVDLIDTPGVNELASRSEDARVTCDVLRDHPDAVIVQVADAKNLRRALLLTLQLAELRRPMILVLNIMDELDKSGGRIDIRKLSSILGIPVVPTIAVASTGIHLLEKNLPHASIPNLKDLDEENGDPFPLPPACGDDYSQNLQRMNRINGIIAETYTMVRPHQPSFTQRLGWWATQPFKGSLLVLLVLYVMFWFVGLFGAGTCVNFFENVIFGRYISPAAITVVDKLLPFPHEHEKADSEFDFEIPIAPEVGILLFKNTETALQPAYHMAEKAPALSTKQKVMRFVHDFLVGEFGLITMALAYGFAIVLPIVTTFFILFSILEDSGYLSRLAVMVNRIFRGMGLNGKAVLPMVLGLGCDTMATMTTRILETRKERVITTLLLALAVPC